MLAAFLVILLLHAYPSFSASDAEDQIIARAIKTNDWVIDASVAKKDKLFNFKESLLQPIMSVSMSCRRTYRHNSNVDSSIKLYEELWYHQDKVLGTRRYSKLDIERGQMGVIVFRESEDIEDAPDAVADSILRTYVDLITKGIRFNGVLLPESSYDATITALTKKGFQPLTDDYELSGRHLLLSLYSYPNRREIDLYFLR